MALKNVPNVGFFDQTCHVLTHYCSFSQTEACFVFIHVFSGPHASYNLKDKQSVAMWHRLQSCTTSPVLAYFVYSWIGRPIRADKKSICQRTRRATINPRPRMKSSRQGESRSSRYIFCDHFLVSYFLKQVKAWPQQKIYPADLDSPRRIV